MQLFEQLGHDPAGFVRNSKGVVRIVCGGALLLAKLGNTNLVHTGDPNAAALGGWNRICAGFHGARFGSSNWAALAGPNVRVIRIRPISG
jgi:hypothetical protein